MINKYFAMICLAVLASMGGIFPTKNPNFSILYDKIFKIKTTNTYEFYFNNESSAFEPTLGYVESVKTLSQEFKAGRIPVNNLNKFEQGLKQYFLTKVYDEEVKGMVLALVLVVAFQVYGKKENSIPITFDNYSDGIVSYNDVTLSWVPLPLNSTGDLKPEVYYEGLSPNHTAKLNVTLKSNMMKFTGNAVVDNSKYNFTYDLKNATLSWYIEISRDPLACRRAEMKLQLSTEEFLITSLNSPHKSDAIVIDIIKKSFPQSLSTNYLLEYNFEPQILLALASFFARSEINFMEAYRKEVLSGIIELATLYINSKGLYTFKVTPFNYSAEAGSIQLEQVYKDIKVEGLLNFVKYETRNASATQSASTTADALLFTYPEDGEKQAFISFVIVDPFGENVKKFKVKRISISTNYTVALVDGRIKLVKSRNGPLNSSEFLVNFELHNFDLNNEVLIKHIENFIARAIDEFLSNETM